MSRQVAGRGVVEWLLAGPGSDLSEELVVGVEPAALDCRVVPGCPPGFAATRRSSVIMVRQMWSARRRFRHRLRADLGTLGSLLSSLAERGAGPNCRVTDLFAVGARKRIGGFLRSAQQEVADEFDRLFER